MKFVLVFLILIFSFFLFADSTPPYVTPLYPTAGSNGIPVNSDVTFYISDDVDGVDISTVLVDINGLIYNSNSGSFYYSGTPFEYYITINPPINFQFEDLVNIQIEASDLEDPANVMTTYSYSFQTIEDLQPPYIGGLNPGSGATDVHLEANIEFMIFDSGNGVNLTSIVVEIDGVTYTHNNGSFSYSGNINAYQIVINVPNDFDYGEIVSVQIDATDLCQPANVMSTFIYSFQYEHDTSSPYIGNYDPESGQQNVPIDTNITFHVYDDELGVDINSVIVCVQNIIYSIANGNLFYSGGVNDYLITIDPLYSFSYEDTIHVSIDTSDLVTPANQMNTFNYLFECNFSEANYQYERVEIDPHTVKWNKPSCTFTIYTEVDLEKISGKIFNRSGKLIKKLVMEEDGYKYAKWYKKDSEENLVSGGFYIYQIIIDKRVYQGSIIIAR